MSSNLKIGVDNAFNNTPTTQVLSANTSFVSRVWGSNVVGDGSITSPYRNLESSLPTSNNNWVLDDSVYHNTGITMPTLSNVKLTAANRHKAIIYSETSVITGLFPNDSIISADGLKIVNTRLGNTLNADYKNCVFDGGNLEISPNEANTYLIENCIFLNTDISIIKQGTNDLSQTITFNNCTFVNSNITEGAITGSYGLVFNKCDIGVNCTISFSDLLNRGVSSLNNCNFRGTQTNTLTATNTITATNQISIDPLYVGDPVNHEFLISPESPLVSTVGLIGAFRIGSILDLTGSTLDNVDIASGIRIQNPSNQGSLTTTWIILANSVKSPNLDYSGFIDRNNQINNDFFSNVLGRGYTVTVEYKESDTSPTESGKFTLGYNMFKDDAGVNFGEDNFNYADIEDGIDQSNLITVKEYRLIFDIYNEIDPSIFNSSLELWINQESLETTGSDDRINKINDLSLNGRNSLMQSSVSNQPQIIFTTTTNMGGRHVLRGKAGTDPKIEWDIASWGASIQPPYFIIHVTNVNTNGNTVNVSYFRNDPSDSSGFGNRCVGFLSGATVNVIAGIFGKATPIAVEYPSITRVDNYSQNHVIMQLFQDDVQKGYIDGIIDFDETTTGNAEELNSFIMFDEPNTTAGRPLNWAETIILSGTIDTNANLLADFYNLYLKRRYPELITQNITF